jgi:hypothetical protein
MNWLENSGEIEKPLIKTCGETVEALIDELLPEIKLSAYEQDGGADIEVKIRVDFKDQTFEVQTQGYVEFPARVIKVVAEEEEADG